MSHLYYSELWVIKSVTPWKTAESPVEGPCGLDEM